MAQNADTVAKESDYHLIQVRTPFVCFLHWAIVLSVVTLALTGLYIGQPELLVGNGEAYATFVMAKVRLLHFTAASTLIVALLLRLYHSFSPATRHDIHEILPTPGNLSAAFKLAKYYLTLGNGEHYHYRYLNPIGGISVFIMVCLFATEAATGFTLYSQTANPITWGWMMWFPGIVQGLLGGMNNVRLLHHLALYGIASLVVIHVYMKVWVDVFFQEADMASIVAGYKVFHKDVIAQHRDRYEGRA